MVPRKLWYYASTDLPKKDRCRLRLSGNSPALCDPIRGRASIRQRDPAAEPDYRTSLGFGGGIFFQVRLHRFGSFRQFHIFAAMSCSSLPIASA